MKLEKLSDELYVPEDFANNHHYFADELGEKEYTGVTTILGVLAKPALIQWAANQAIEHIRDRAKEYFYDGGTDDVGWKALLEEARTAHRKKKEAAAEKGTSTHEMVENWVLACIKGAEGKPEAALYDISIKPFIDWAIRENITFLASEKALVSRKLFVAGTCDLVFEKDGKRYIGDIKTYKKIWDRVPLIQCAGYALMNEEMGNTKADGYCIICLPKERTFNPVDDVLWSHDTEGDREAFMSCVRLYRYLNNK